MSLIDREKLRAEVRRLDANGTASWVSGFGYALDKVLEVIDAAPPADPVEGHEPILETNDLPYDEYGEWLACSCGWNANGTNVTDEPWSVHVRAAASEGQDR